MCIYIYVYTCMAQTCSQDVISYSCAHTLAPSHPALDNSLIAAFFVYFSLPFLLFIIDPQMLFATVRVLVSSRFPSRWALAPSRALPRPAWSAAGRLICLCVDLASFLIWSTVSVTYGVVCVLRHSICIHIYIYVYIFILDET